jgi:hypothetical protein
MKISKIIFANVSGVKDYKRLEKLAQAYEKAKASNIAKPSSHRVKEMDKLKAEIQKLMPDVEEGLNRVVSIYAGAVKEMGENNATYGQDDTKSFYNELIRMQENVAKYKKMVE